MVKSILRIGKLSLVGKVGVEGHICELLLADDFENAGLLEVESDGVHISKQLFEIRRS
jgi:hypothetical protein